MRKKVKFIVIYFDVTQLDDFQPKNCRGSQEPISFVSLNPPKICFTELLIVSYVSYEASNCFPNSARKMSYEELKFHLSLVSLKNQQNS